MAERNTPKPAHIARARPAKKRVRDRRIPGAMGYDEAGRLGAAASPWSREPMNERARRSARYQMIRAAAEGRKVQPMKVRRDS